MCQWNALAGREGKGRNWGIGEGKKGRFGFVWDFSSVSVKPYAEAKLAKFVASWCICSIHSISFWVYIVSKWTGKQRFYCVLHYSIGRTSFNLSRCICLPCKIWGSCNVCPQNVSILNLEQAPPKLPQFSFLCHFPYFQLQLSSPHCISITLETFFFYLWQSLPSSWLWNKFLEVLFLWKMIKSALWLPDQCVHKIPHLAEPGRWRRNFGKQANCLPRWMKHGGTTPFPSSFFGKGVELLN